MPFPVPTSFGAHRERRRSPGLSTAAQTPRAEANNRDEPAPSPVQSTSNSHAYTHPQDPPMHPAHAPLPPPSVPSVPADVTSGGGAPADIVPCAMDNGGLVGIVCDLADLSSPGLATPNANAGPAVRSNTLFNTAIPSIVTMDPKDVLPATSPATPKATTGPYRIPQRVLSPGAGPSAPPSTPVRSLRNTPQALSLGGRGDVPAGPLSAPLSRLAGVARARGISLDIGGQAKAPTPRAPGTGGIDLAIGRRAKSPRSPLSSSVVSPGRMRGLTVALVMGDELLAESDPVTPSISRLAHPRPKPDAPAEAGQPADAQPTPTIAGPLSATPMPTPTTAVASPITGDASHRKEIILCRYYHTKGMACTSSPCRFVHALDPSMRAAAAAAGVLRTPLTPTIGAITPFALSRRGSATGTADDPTHGTFAAAQAAAPVTARLSLNAEIDVAGVKSGEAVAVRDEQTGEDVVALVFKMSGGGKGPGGRSRSKLKTVPCRDYAQGHCPYGDYCSFIHDPNNLYDAKVHGKKPVPGSATADASEPPLNSATDSRRDGDSTPSASPPSDSSPAMPETPQMGDAQHVPEPHKVSSHSEVVMTPPPESETVLQSSSAKTHEPATPHHDDDDMPLSPTLTTDFSYVANDTWDGPHYMQHQGPETGTHQWVSPLWINQWPAPAWPDAPTPWSPQEMNTQQWPWSPSSMPPMSPMITTGPMSMMSMDSMSPMSPMSPVVTTMPMQPLTPSWGTEGSVPGVESPMPLTPDSANDALGFTQPRPPHAVASDGPPYPPQAQHSGFSVGTILTPQGWAVADVAALPFRRWPRSYYKTKPCRFFAEGHCPRGETCAFRHELNPAPPRLPPRTQSRKTIPCKFFNSTVGCNNADADCAFLHVRVIPEQAPRAAPRPFRTIPCRHFQVGRCVRGESCQFAHVKVSPSAIPVLPPKAKAKPKANHKPKDQHQSRPRSVSEHTEQPGSPPVLPSACWDWEAGHCHRGTMCPFTHAHDTPGAGADADTHVEGAMALTEERLAAACAELRAKAAAASEAESDDDDDDDVEIVTNVESLSTHRSSGARSV